MCYAVSTSSDDVATGVYHGVGRLCSESYDERTRTTMPTRYLRGTVAVMRRNPQPGLPKPIIDSVHLPKVDGSIQVIKITILADTSPYETDDRR